MSTPAFATNNNPNLPLSHPEHRILASFTIYKHGTDSLEAIITSVNMILKNVHCEFRSLGFEPSKLRPLLNAKFFQYLNAPEENFPFRIAVVICEEHNGFGVVQLQI
jgi:hypothetical protein